jgi:hypothetical protein
MAISKVTFTLDQATINRIQEAAERLSLPKSGVVREAVQEFFDRIWRLSDRERLKMLRTFDEVIPRIPNRHVKEVELELRVIRQARRSGGRRTVCQESFKQSRKTAAQFPPTVCREPRSIARRCTG